MQRHKSTSKSAGTAEVPEMQYQGTEPQSMRDRTEIVGLSFSFLS